MSRNEMFESPFLEPHRFGNSLVEQQTSALFLNLSETSVPRLPQRLGDFFGRRVCGGNEMAPMVRVFEVRDLNDGTSSLYLDGPEMRFLYKKTGLLTLLKFSEQ